MRQAKRGWSALPVTSRCGGDDDRFPLDGDDGMIDSGGAVAGNRSSRLSSRASFSHGVNCGGFFA